jgi:hypothetical protein
VKVENAKTMPKVFYGLHMVEGVAEYKEPQINNGQPYRIFVGENCIKNMDTTFTGRPLYVTHVDDVNLDNLQAEADGYVVESFFNKSDGKHWAKFIVVSDRGHEAIRSGWKLSNAYIPKKFSGGGLWHGVEYLKEVEEAEYEHLALVPNPRYEESIILTPEEFKNYNDQKESELKKFSNSITKGAKSMFSFFKKSKIENGADFDEMSVILPKSKKEKTLAQVINESDEMEMNAKEEQPMCNMEHYVNYGGKKMKLNEIMSMLEGMTKKQEAEKKPEMEEKKEEAAKNEEKEIHVDIDSHKGKEKMEDAMSDEEAKKKALALAEHEEKEIEEEKKEKKSNHFDILKNAELDAITSEKAIELSADKVARGKARYGS